MNVTFLHHSCFLLETERVYYLFDYFKGQLPKLDVTKPILVLSSHGHSDHYNPEVFRLLEQAGMEKVRAVLSDDIVPPAGVDALSVAPDGVYALGEGQNLTTFRSTDLGVAFLIEEDGVLIYHAGDLNDWVWEGEPEDYNQEMTANYSKQMDLLADTLQGRAIDLAFVVLDPRQEKDYARGMCRFLEQIPAKRVYPMHYWGKPEIMDTFLKEYPQYHSLIQKTE